MRRDELEKLAEKHFGAWAGTRIPPDPPPVAANRDRGILIIDKPGSPQTYLRIGHLGIERAHSGYVPVTVMNAALGGLFSSRINMNLRENHGCTYGASSAFVCRRGPGAFVVGTSVRTDVTAPSVSKILLEIARMRSSASTLEELDTARNSIARSLPGLFETTLQAAATQARLFVHNLPLDYYRTLPAEIDRVSTEDVLRMAREHLRPEEAIIVAVGDRSCILKPLARLDFGPMCLDAEGNPVDFCS